MPKGHIKDSSGTNVIQDSSTLRQIKDVTNALEILDSPQIQTNPFGANVSGDNSYRRAERLAAALHLVTSHIPENEPLRISVREAGLRLLGKILELRSGFRAAASEKGQSALAEIRSIISQVRLLAIAGYVSGSNARSVVEALDELGNLIVISQKSTLAEQVSLTRNDLLPPTQQIYRTNIRQIRPEDAKISVAAEDKKDTSTNKSTNSVIGDRANRILDILRIGGELGIKDIASNLPQYSEKMIQRELAGLISGKSVTKVGEKRWSKYRAFSSQ